MKKNEIKKLNILEIILIISPIIDILTAISERNLGINISFGLIIRSFFMFLMIMYVLVKSSYKYKKHSIIYMFLIFTYLLIYVLNMYFEKGMKNTIIEIKEVSKTFYFPICIITILNYVETNKYKINKKVLLYVILEYITLLFIPHIFNLGYESYAEDKIGSIGWFFSANEISSIYTILISLVIFSYDYIKSKKIYIFLVLYSLYTILQIGTKIPAIAAGISILGFIIVKLIKYKIYKNKNNLYAIIHEFFIFLIFIFIFVTSPVYKNFIIYKEYLIDTRENDQIENIQIQEEYGTNKEVITENLETNEIKIEQLQDNNIKAETLTSDEIATIIHSGRIETKNEIEYIFKKSSIKNKILGLGKLNIEQNDYFLSEIDYYDIFFNYGFLGFIIYFIPIIMFIIICIKRTNLEYLKFILSDEKRVAFLIGILNGLFLGAISGHTLVAPAVSIFIAIMIIEIYRENINKI